MNISPRKCFGKSDVLANICNTLEIDVDHLLLMDAPLITIILDHSGLPIWEPTMFLLEVDAVGRSQTGDTVRTYGESLVDWFRFLGQIDVSFQNADEAHFASYRKRLTHGQCGLKPATANLRIAVTVEFHKWGADAAAFESPLGLSLIDRAIKNQHRGKGRIRGLAPTVIQQTPVSLHLSEWYQIASRASNPYALMYDWAITTGVRRFELCSLTTAMLPSEAAMSFSTDGFMPIRIVGKGSKERTLEVPIQLLDRTLWYVAMERPIPRPGFERYIFLNSSGAPVSKASLSNAFRADADSVGSKANLHKLRHTFAGAVDEYATVLENRGNAVNAKKIVQKMLGHSSIKTTDIYLEGARNNPAKSAVLAFLYGERP